MNDKADFLTLFATKEELRITNHKVDEMAMKGAAMSESLSKLTESVAEISKDLKSLLINKGVSEGINKFAVKCTFVAASFIASIVIPLLTAHALGYTKIFARWLNG